MRIGGGGGGGASFAIRNTQSSAQRLARNPAPEWHSFELLARGGGRGGGGGERRRRRKRFNPKLCPNVSSINPPQHQMLIGLICERKRARSRQAWRPRRGGGGGGGEVLAIKTSRRGTGRFCKGWDGFACRRLIRLAFLEWNGMWPCLHISLHTLACF